MLKKWPKIKQLCSEIRWIVLGIVWLAALLLGYMGFSLFSIENSKVWTTSDMVYQTLQLIMLESGSVDGKVNWMLETARYLLPALTAFTAFQALMPLFHEQVQWLRLWRLRDHIIFCGLGQKGKHLAEELLKQGFPLVIIDKEPDQASAAELMKRGAILLTGDVTDRKILLSARLHRARYLICLLGEDHQNMQVAFQAYELTRGRRKGTITCIIHLTSPDLLNLLKSSELSFGVDVPFQLETFNPFARAARMLLHEDHLLPDNSNHGALPDHLLLIGMGRLGENLVVQAAHAWYTQKSPGHLNITVLDNEAEAKTARLLKKNPQLVGVCHINPVNIGISSTKFLHKELDKVNNQKQIQRVFICVSDPVLSLQVCLILIQNTLYRNMPIRVRLAKESGLHGFLDKLITEGADTERVVPFSLYEDTYSTTLVMGGLHELLARELHELYSSEIRASSFDHTTTIPWDQLPDETKKDNRQQANRINHLLNAADYQISPLRNWDSDQLIFTTEEIEKMAQIEHELWCQAKQAEGWYWGSQRDDKKRSHPDLIPWDQLPEEEKKKNRVFIIQLPALLGRLGFQLDHVEGLKNYS